MSLPQVCGGPAVNLLSVCRKSAVAGDTHAPRPHHGRTDLDFHGCAQMVAQGRIEPTSILTVLSRWSHTECYAEYCDVDDDALPPDMRCHRCRCTGFSARACRFPPRSRMCCHRCMHNCWVFRTRTPPHPASARRSRAPTRAGPHRAEPTRAWLHKAEPHRATQG